MNSILKNVVITFSSRILIFAIGLITSIVLARALGPQGKGIYTLIILIPAIMLKLGSLGIEAANVYFIGARKYKIEDIVSNSLFSSIFLSLVLITLFFGVSYLKLFRNFLNSNQLNEIYLWFAVLTVPFSLLSEYLKSIILGKEEIITYNKITIFQTILQLVTISIFLLIFKQGIFGAIIAHVVTIICVMLLVVFFIKKSTKIYISYNIKLLKDTINYGVKAYFANLTTFLNYRLDIFLVAFFLSPIEVGYYSIAVGIAEKIWMLPGAIATVLFPRVSSIKDVEANNLTPRVTRNTFLVSLIVSLILAVLAKPLIKILFGNEFLPSVIPLLILLPGIIALSFPKVLTADLAGRGKPKYSVYASVISLGINIPLNLWFIPRWGISGAAFASSLAYIVATLIIINAFLKISGKTRSNILIIGKTDFQDYKNFLYKIRKRILDYF